MPNYMAICACILAQIIAIGLMVFLILKTFEVGKNIPQPNAINQQRTNSEFDHLKGEELFQAVKQKYKKPQPNGINEQKKTSEFAHLKGAELIQALKKKYKKPQPDGINKQLNKI